jgi:hypothetical protein
MPFAAASSARQTFVNHFTQRSDLMIIVVMIIDIQVNCEALTRRLPEMP